MDTTSPWASFAHDPRDPAHAALRAADRDRDVVHAVLDDAYADGRLDREELDERRAATLAARTLGDLPPLLADLVPTPRETIHGLAVERWRRDQREALATFLVPSLVCLVIWAIVMPGGFFWPAFVMLGTGVNLLQTRLRRDDIVADHVRKLEKKQARALRPKADDS